MTNFRSLMDISAEDWLAAMRLSEADIPDAVIVEGSWSRAQRTQWRLSYLQDVRELHFPDIFWGRWRDRKIVYCCAYGPSRAAEIIHLFGILGTRLAVQIGSCGGLQPTLQPGHIMLPDVAICRDGVAHLYGAAEAAFGSSSWIEAAEALLAEKGHTTRRGTHVTWPSLFNEPVRVLQAWHRAGYLSVDMETATTFSVAHYFGMPAVSMLVVWDDLTRGRTFLDPMSEAEKEALDMGNRSIYEVALALAGQI